MTRFPNSYRRDYTGWVSPRTFWWCMAAMFVAGTSCGTALGVSL